MNKTKIEWADSTWNPVTGCLHGCEYCYARKIANRFGRKYLPYGNGNNEISKAYDGEKGIDPYPFGFDPTFHRYRLDEPQRMKKPRNIFVCSMADLFGDWVPDEWIHEVFKACEAAPWHNYLFLTKNPYRYAQLLLRGRLIGGKHIWLGTTIADGEKLPFNALDFKQNFISVEPILKPVSDKFPFTNVQWVIVGAETGNRKGKIIPEKEWIESLVKQCRAASIPVFMKDSLIPIMGEENMLREFPVGLKG